MSLKIGFWLNVPQLSIITVSTYNYSFVLYHKWSIKKRFNANCIFFLKSHAVYITKNLHTCMFMPIIYYHQYNKLASYDWRLEKHTITDASFLECWLYISIPLRIIAKLQDKIDVSSRGKANFCVFPRIY